MKKLFIIIVLFTVFSQVVWAQGGNFTQRSFAPLLINPASPAAQTDMKLMLHYKFQQFHAGRQMENTLITAMYPFFKEEGQSFWALGFSFFNEQESGSSGLNRQSFDLATAYALNLPAGHYVSLGLQFAYRQFGVRTGGFTTGSQWEDNFGFNPGLPTGEVFIDERPSYFDLGTGAVWYALDPKGEKKFFLSAAAYRINGPSVNLISKENAENIPYNLTLHGGYTIWANNKFAVMPEMYFQKEGLIRNYNGGATVRYHFKNENPFDPVQSGTIALTTLMDQNGAVRFGLLFEQPQYEVALAYDLTAAQFGQVQTSKNAAEIGVSFRKSLFKPKAKRIKADRYVSGDVRIFELDEVKALEEEREADDPQQEVVVDVTNEALRNAANKANEEKKAKGKFQLALRKDFSFGFNEVTLSSKAKNYLEDIFLLMDQNKELKLQVIGHTDNQGAQSVNNEISLARAESVIAYLRNRGIEPSRMEAIGMGDREPLAENNSDKNRAKNRRVEFILYQE